MERKLLSKFGLMTFLSLLFCFYSTSLCFSASIEAVLDEINKTLDTINAALSGKSYSETREVGESSAFVGGIFRKWEAAWEKTAGEEGHKALQKKPGFYRDKYMLNRLGNVARRLVPTVERQELKYHFAILDSDELNAFALPGGYVYVTKGLMKVIDSDDELAGVIAHELGHINKKHGIRQAEKAGIMAAVIALMGLKDETAKYQKAAAIAAFFAQMKFSRDDEFEADRCAVRYTMKAGYNPYGLITFFNRINRDNKLSKVTKYFSTHPPTTERIKRVREEIRKNGGIVSEPVMAQNSVTGLTHSPERDPYSNIPGIEDTTNNVRYTHADLREAYEEYCYFKEQYEYKVANNAPINEIMATLKKYQLAKEKYFRIKQAVSY